MNVKRLHRCTPSAVPSSDRPYPLIFLIPYIIGGNPMINARGMLPK